jgi:hypothetical protein
MHQGEQGQAATIRLLHFVIKAAERRLGAASDFARSIYLSGEGVSAMTGKDTSLIAREGRLSALRELAAPPYAESRALLLGDLSVGKLSLP